MLEEITPLFQARFNFILQQKAINVKNEILRLLNQDGLTTFGFIRVFKGSTSGNKLESVTIELTLFGYLETDYGKQLHFY
jgi:hypothetical protein